MQHFYDGQIRRYITQIVRLMSNFSYKDGSGKLTQIPVMYGDMTRQVASILRDNSENKIPSAPRMAVYVTGLEMDRERTSDSSFVSKINIVEKVYDEQNNQYLNEQGKNFTVERLMPTPYTLSLNVDIWSTNTDQKLQILEQIFMLFNPSLEIQTTDNYVDWTSLSVVNLDSIGFSSRTIPVGTESEIDVATLGFSTPIFISPPAKVKRLGIITNVITSIFNEETGDIDLATSRPELKAYDDSAKVYQTDTSAQGFDNEDSLVTTTINNYGLYIDGTIARLISNQGLGANSWSDYLELLPGNYTAGLSTIRLNRKDLTNEVVGSIAVNESNPTELIVNWDEDTFPTNTVIAGRGQVDSIIDPENFDTSIVVPGTRLLTLGNIGNQDLLGLPLVIGTGPNAWKNASGTDFIASENDIIEWDGSNWSILFDASETDTLTYTTNLTTGIQYKWTGEEWLLSVEGEYQNGSWRITL